MHINQLAAGGVGSARAMCQWAVKWDSAAVKRDNLMPDFIDVLRLIAERIAKAAIVIQLYM